MDLLGAAPGELPRATVSVEWVRVINLLDGLRPFAQTELLYFRDDDHLTPRRHAVAARILVEHLRTLDSILGR
jgi:hypothetical protein